MMAGQNQKTRIVRHQLQSVGAVRTTPANPLIARSTLECHRQRGVIHSCFPFQTAMTRSLNEFLPNVQLWTYLFILYYESAIGNFALLCILSNIAYGEHIQTGGRHQT